MSLTLSEKSYLAEIISKYFPDEENSYEIASHFTSAQRGKFLAHYFKKENNEAREVIENVKAFQTQLIK